MVPRRGPNCLQIAKCAVPAASSLSCTQLGSFLNSNLPMPLIGFEAQIAIPIRLSFLKLTYRRVDLQSG